MPATGSPARMPEIFDPLAAIAGEELALLAFGALVAGIVRGFTGFGTAMIYLPIAGQVLPPFSAITTMIVMDLAGPLPSMPRAWREGTPRDVLRLGIGALFALPAGVAILALVQAEVFRYAVSFVCAAFLILMIAGVRYTGELKRGMIYVTGSISGFLAGCTGLPGPPVIMLYMASPKPVRVIRANITMYLLVSDVLFLVVLGLSRQLDFRAMTLGAIIMIVYLAANVAGAAMFRPGMERIYRPIAYAIIALSALMRLPLPD